MGGLRLPPPLAALFLGLAPALPDWWAAAVGVAPRGRGGVEGCSPQPSLARGAHGDARRVLQPEAGQQFLIKAGNVGLGFALFF